MTVAELVSKFRQYIDEPDQTFVSDADVNTYLDDGYREFRNMVCDINPVIYNVTADIACPTPSATTWPPSTPSFWVRLLPLVAAW